MCSSEFDWIERVMGLDAGSDQRAEGEPENDSEKDVTGSHGGGSGLMRAPWGARLTLDDEFGVALAFHVCSDTGQFDLGTVCHSRANERRHGSGECADVHQACSVPLLELVHFTLFRFGHAVDSWLVADKLV
jgi:hypothetical protein